MMQKLVSYGYVEIVLAHASLPYPNNYNHP
jgi:hypothetical protein